MFGRPSTSSSNSAWTSASSLSRPAIRVAEFFARGQQRGNVLPLGLGFPDVLRVRIAGSTHFIRGNLGGLAAVLERLETLDVELEAATREVRGDSGRIGTKQAGVEHGGQPEGSGKREL